MGISIRAIAFALGQREFHSSASMLIVALCFPIGLSNS